MEFLHRKEKYSESRVMVNGEDYIVDGKGVFEIPDEKVDKELVNKLSELGHKKLFNISSDEEEIKSDESEDSPLKGFSEEDIVNMNYNNMQGLASQFDDINGNAKGDIIEEELIKKLRNLNSKSE